MSKNNNRRRIWILLVLFAVAFAARFFLISKLEHRVVYSDEKKNLLLADNLAGGSGYRLGDGRPTAVVPVGYPIWLCALRLMGLAQLWHIRLVQLLLSLLTIFFVYLFSRMLFGPAAAVAAAAACAVYPYFIFLPGTILATTLYSMLLVLGTYLYVKAVTTSNNKMMFFGGLIWGWAVLTVSTAIVLACATLVWHLRHGRGPWKGALQQMALFLAGLMLVVLPWMVRNQLVLGRMTMATNGGYNLWLGNNPASDMDEPCSVPTPAEMDERIIASGSEVFADSLFSAAAWSYILYDPWSFGQRTVLKALYFWRLDPSPVTASYIHNEGLARIAGMFTFAPLLLLAFWGYRTAPPLLRKKIALFFYFAVFYTAVHAVMIVKVRLRLPIDHFVIMTAAFGLIGAWSQWRSKCHERKLVRE